MKSEITLDMAQKYLSVGDVVYTPYRKGGLIITGFITAGNTYSMDLKNEFTPLARACEDGVLVLNPKSGGHWRMNLKEISRVITGVNGYYVERKSLTQEQEFERFFE